MTYPDNLPESAKNLNLIAKAAGYKPVSYEYMQIRPGATVLDMGCGGGDDLPFLSQAVGNTGKVLGVDTFCRPSQLESRNVIKSAKSNLTANVSLFVMDGRQLGFPNNYIDAARIDRVLQLIQVPFPIVAELFRVLKPDSCLVACDPVWSGFKITGLPVDDQFIQKMLNVYTAPIPNPNITKDYPQLLTHAGFRVTSQEVYIDTITDPHIARNIFYPDQWLNKLVAEEKLSVEETNLWKSAFHAPRENFLCQIPMMIATSIKP